jgi:predicted metal-dependent enzyme (double-stranded beta helix superfamily)
MGTGPIFLKHRAQGKWVLSPFLVALFLRVVFSGEAAEAGFTADELSRAVRVSLDGGGTEMEKMARVAEVLRRFLREGTLDEAVRTPHPGLDVTTYLLYVAPDGSFSIASLVIRPGARTPIHDHQTWTVWGTMVGADRETRYEARGAGPVPDLIPVGTRTLPDSGVSLIPGPPQDIHRLENVGSEPSVSIHIHGADMSRQTRNAYDERKKTVTQFVQSYVSVPGGDR